VHITGVCSRHANRMVDPGQQIDSAHNNDRCNASTHNLRYPQNASYRTLQVSAVRTTTHARRQPHMASACHVHAALLRPTSSPHIRSIPFDTTTPPHHRLQQVDTASSPLHAQQRHWLWHCTHSRTETQPGRVNQTDTALPFIEYGICFANFVRHQSKIKPLQESADSNRGFGSSS
jgi:hypothetical protein